MFLRHIFTRTCTHARAHTQTKSPAVLTTYMVYVKDSLGVQGSGVTEGEIVSLLRDCVALVTKKHGAIQPAKDVLHFSSQFQPTYDLEKLFPGICTYIMCSVKPLIRVS